MTGNTSHDAITPMLTLLDLLDAVQGPDDDTARTILNQIDRLAEVTLLLTKLHLAELAAFGVDTATYTSTMRAGLSWASATAEATP